ncbi:hypothetical protein CHLRE_10g420561v5 [Chlamydomonas reinhardtii]|uniref:Right handed beta helix domain-containing protein n=1 Tax=Chlamydomonas reinhardtii TaxID=3055 RepID=A0A2K3D951_CHLRE|nr:uncharacterized protein CHLRE_10g420561v5 [Chlamydomonas reinhardtii]PNW77062.1 hypothetical protein CHLRE_10g420561v5 [Chlamydomonas reinhardtii]
MANLSVANCVFTEFTRALLDPARVDIGNAASVVQATDGTRALAIHITEFSGTLSLKDTVFTGNHFLPPPPQSETTEPSSPPSYGGYGGYGGGTYGGYGASGFGGSFGEYGGGSAASDPQAARHHRRRQARAVGVHAAACSTSSAGALLGQCSAAAMGRAMDSRQQQLLPGSHRAALSSRSQHQQQQRMPLTASEVSRRQRRRLLQDSSSAAGGTSGGPSAAKVRAIASQRPLEYAKVLHEGLREGPWADDMEAVAAVTCGRGANTSSDTTCSVTLQNVTFEYNTGVATSGLYVLCDGAARCDVRLHNTSLRHNRLLWQAALEPGDLQGGAVSPYDDTGLQLFRRVMPWLTYTYPLMYIWGGMKSFKAWGSPLYDLFVDPNDPNVGPLPDVTGRTLGAVVVHSRHPPAVGVAPGGAGMVSLVVEGGEFEDNDGAAVMTTAADWSSVAGGHGNWSEEAPMRHALDAVIRGVTARNHGSGMPVFWLRWAKSVSVSDCQFDTTTGSLWLDEARDQAAITDTTFTRSVLPEQMWLYAQSFLAVAPLEGIQYVNDMGAGSHHSVMVAMTAQGQAETHVTVDRCVFEDNPSYVYGTLFVVGVDHLTPDKNQLPGRMKVVVSNSVFAHNYCRRVPPGAGPDAECLTGERPLYVTQAFHTEVANCSFTGNRNGALSIDTSGGLLVRDSNFTNNVQTYYATGLYVDESSGGAGVVAIQIGRGAVELTGSQFVNNSSPQGGGAAYFSDIYYLRMSNCTFDSNSAPWGDGGAVRVMTTEATADDVQNDSESNSGLAVDSIIDCIFVNNTAGRRGGAIAGVKASLDNTWTIATSAFVNNRAMLFPNVTDILVRSDQAGGGALYAEQLNSLDLTNCTFDGNRVARHAGGAVRVVDMSGVLTTKGVLFQNNAAIVGGALAASRVAQVRITVTSPDELVPSAFINNTAVDPWTWPDTSPLPHVRNNTLYPSLNDLGVGYGGAVHVAYGKFIIDKTALFYNNSAVAGGAIATLYCAEVWLDANLQAQTEVSNLTLAPQHAGAPGGVVRVYGDAAPAATVPYSILFANNSAMLGGALFTQGTTDLKSFYGLQGLQQDVEGPPSDDVLRQGWTVQDYYDSDNITRYIISPSNALARLPVIVFYNNTANGGGAIYIDGADQVHLQGIRLLANRALAPPLAPGHKGLYGREALANGSVAGQPCYRGDGGAVCVTGRAGSSVLTGAGMLCHKSCGEGGTDNRLQRP